MKYLTSRHDISSIITRQKLWRSVGVAAIAVATASTATAAATQTVIYRFKGGTQPGSPYSDVLIGKNGTVYATAYSGALGSGTVLQLTPPSGGTGAWTATVIYRFKGGQDGANPLGALVEDKTGALYGTTSQGGSSSNCVAGCGTVFKLTPPAKGSTAWTETVLHSFGAPAGGTSPVNGLVFSQGSLFGTAALNGGHDRVFQLAPPTIGNPDWAYKTIYSFVAPKNGAFVNSTLITDQSGNLYGTTYQGGSINNGTVFKLTPPAAAGKPWTQSVLHSFLGGDEGFRPYALAFDTKGALYGVTTWGPDYGGVYKLTPPAGKGAWTISSIYSFTNPGVTGQRPTGKLAIDAKGNVVGTTTGGGPKSCGTVFELAPPVFPTGKWKQTRLYSFTGGNNGCNVYDGGTLYYAFGGVVADATGNIYGTTSSSVNPNGEPYNPAGTIFKLSGTGF